MKISSHLAFLLFFSQALFAAPSPDMASVSLDLLKILLMLIAVVLLIFLALRFIASKSRKYQHQSGRLKIIAKIQADPRTCVFLLEADGQKILLASSPSSMHMQQLRDFADTTKQTKME